MLRLSFALLLASAAPAMGRETLPGPVEATVERVIDGDTLLVRALVWPGHSVRVSVRVRGIDAPEIRSRCDDERAAAQVAREALAEMVRDGPIVMSTISGDKYFGRVLADVATAGGEAVAQSLLAAGLVQPYRGGKRRPHCG